MNAFGIDIVTQDKILYRGRAVSLIVPAEQGYLGVLANHTPLVARLIKGRIKLRDESGSIEFFQCEDKGFLEVLRNNATIILDA